MGNTWSDIFNSPTLFWGKILPISVREIFLINDNLIYRSLNNALSWDTISIFPDSVALSDIFFSSDSSLYLSTTRGIYKSINLGETWSKIELELTNIEGKNPFVKNYQLSQNYPNPFNPSTKISWQSPVSGHQTLKIYDVLGNEVATLVNEFKPAGNYEVDFNASSLSSGIYFYRLTTGTFVQTKKMILIK